MKTVKAEDVIGFFTVMLKATGKLKRLELNAQRAPKSDLHALMAW